MSTRGYVRLADDEFRVLDHGYVKLVETMGSDERIIEAARMSTGGGFRGWGPRCAGCGESSLYREERIAAGRYRCDCGAVDTKPGDEKLLAYLWKNKHTTPFEMCSLIVEVKAPIFIYRQWHRHRTQSYNEMSARYMPLPDEHYVPTVDRLMMSSDKNKQAGKAKGADALSKEDAECFLEELRTSYRVQEDFYQRSLAAGVPKELARIHLPVARYSVMRASANLLNWLKFLTLRCDSHAQWEIQQYAWAVAVFIEEAFPRTYALWKESR